MNKIWLLLVDHVRRDFHATAYACTGAFLIASLAFNYAINFEDNYLDTLPDLTRFAAYLVWHSLAWFVPVMSVGYFKKLQPLLWSKTFLGTSVFALVLLSLDRVLPFVSQTIISFFHPLTHYYLIKLANNLSGLVVLVFPLLAYYLLYHRNQGHFYGLRPGGISLRPYLVLLLLMLPVLVAAAFLPGFQAQYPMYHKTPADVYWQWPAWATATVYEISYALNFVAVEFFYRGFLVLGMAAWLGRSSVLCMSVLYCFLHFGKPLPEAISSIAGGYILGVISFETRSIWGGILVHIGIAWTMEFLGFII
ncbi:MAG: hypothetical protein KatS3mg032_0358 [Cyclobacteriaceae bacterium]|nr:MAG: hypothetical protein KatS3mg032_0358 [Cyclobacteriaceae bacterium]